MLSDPVAVLLSPSRLRRARAVSLGRRAGHGHGRGRGRGRATTTRPSGSTRRRPRRPAGLEVQSWEGSSPEPQQVRGRGGDLAGSRSTRSRRATLRSSSGAARRRRRAWRGRARACSPRGSVGARRLLEGFALRSGRYLYAGIYPVDRHPARVPGGGPGNGLEFNETSLNWPGSRRARSASATATNSSAGCCRSAALPATFRGSRTSGGRRLHVDCEATTSGLSQQRVQGQRAHDRQVHFRRGREGQHLGIASSASSGRRSTSRTFPVRRPRRPGLAPATVPAAANQFAAACAVDLGVSDARGDGDIIPRDTLVPGAESQQISSGPK